MMISLSYGQIIGRDHMQRQVNCQDGLAIREGRANDEDFIIGVVTDGCGSGKHSEVGAKIFAEYIAECCTDPEYLYFLHHSSDPWRLVSCWLYRTTVLQMRDRFPVILSGSTIEDYLLFTVVGFIMTKGIIYWFKKGDGLVIYKDAGGELYNRDPEDYKNMPPYIGYELVHPDTLTMEFKSGFKIGQDTLSKGSKFMIATDGLEDEFIDQIWEKPNRRLQRFLNLQSNKHKKLADDTSVIIVENIDEH